MLVQENLLEVLIHQRSVCIVFLKKIEEEFLPLESVREVMESFALTSVPLAKLVN